MIQRKTATAPTPRSDDARHVALLRGVNVGGKNKLPMSGLVAVCEAAGCREVVTYIQSGNVAFTAAAALTERLGGVIVQELARRHGLRVPVVLRTAGELEQLPRSNPFLRRDADTDALHVMFLADAPSASAVAGLDPRRSPPDEFAVVGRDVFLRCPQGLGRTRLTNDYFDAKLATTSTVRNWRTVLKLIELTRSQEGPR